MSSTSSLKMPCPSCAAELVIGNAEPTHPRICGACGTQFAIGGKYPVLRTSKKAVLSFVLGIFSLFGLFITGIPAFLLGRAALSQIRNSSHCLRGKSLAYIGTVLGVCFSFTLLLLPMIIASVWAAGSFQASIGTDRKRAPKIPAGAIPISEPGVRWTWLHPLDGRDPGVVQAGFSTVDFDDSEWQTGAEHEGGYGFGYGDPVGVVIGRPGEGDRYSAYFRHRFTTTEPFDRLLITFFCDDGAVVYLDGRELGRNNVRNREVVGFTTLASRTIGGEMERAVIGIESPLPLAPGEHVLTISLHNAKSDSSDLAIGNVRLYGIRD